jgi:hypothetical protein
MHYAAFAAHGIAQVEELRDLEFALRCLAAPDHRLESRNLYRKRAAEGATNVSLVHDCPPDPHVAPAAGAPQASPAGFPAVVVNRRRDNGEY